MPGDGCLTCNATGLVLQDGTYNNLEYVIIPPMTSDQEILRFEGRGNPSPLKRGSGDLYVKIRVQEADFQREGLDVVSHV